MIKYLKIEYLYIIIMIIWYPLQYFILKVDGAGRTLVFLSIITFLYYLNTWSFRSIVSLRPLVIWGIWIIYAFIDTMILGYKSTEISPPLFFFSLLSPLLLMIVIYFGLYNDRKTTLNVIIAVLYAHLILVTIFSSKMHSARGTLGSELDENFVAISTAILVFFLMLKRLYKEISGVGFALSLILPTAIIVLSGSRTGFACLLILIIGAIMSRRSKYGVVNFMTLLVVSGFLYAGYNYVIKNTILGERIRMTSSQIMGDESLFSGTALDKLGDRGIFYYRGYKLFEEHPVSGIGLGNFRYEGGLNLVMHSEYMIQLCELGVIGSLIFLIFYIWVGRGLLISWRRYPQHRRLTEMYIAGFLVILFANAWIFTYYMTVYFSYFAVSIHHIYTLKYSHEQE